MVGRILSFVVLMVLGSTSPVLATNPIAEVLCEPTGRLHDKLMTRMGGMKTATGIRSPEQIMEIWTDRSGGWTLVMTYASGTSCIVAMGDDWAPVAPKEPT